MYQCLNDYIWCGSRDGSREGTQEYILALIKMYCLLNTFYPSGILSAIIVDQVLPRMELSINNKYLYFMTLLEF